MWEKPPVTLSVLSLFSLPLPCENTEREKGREREVHDSQTKGKRKKDDTSKDSEKSFGINPLHRPLMECVPGELTQYRELIQKFLLEKIVDNTVWSLKSLRN